MVALRDATPTDAPAIAAVHVASWRVAYRGLLPDDLLDGLSVADRTAVRVERLAAPDRHAGLRAQPRPPVLAELPEVPVDVEEGCCPPSCAGPRRPTSRHRT